MTVRIYVATQRSSGLPTVENYVPLAVGKSELSIEGGQNDSTGDSISARNGFYCELTGHYWIWRNDASSDVVGLCQYRRFLWLREPPRRLCSQNFSSIEECSEHLSTDDLERLLDGRDVILPRPYAFSSDTIETQFVKAHGRENFEQMLRSIERTHPESLSTARKVFGRRTEYLANLLIARRKIFDEYSRWLFDVLFDVEKNIRLDASNGRMLGYMGERLLNVYAAAARLRVREVPLIFIGAPTDSARIDLRYFKRRYLPALLTVEDNLRRKFR